MRCKEISAAGLSKQLHKFTVIKRKNWKLWHCDISTVKNPKEERIDWHRAALLGDATELRQSHFCPLGLLRTLWPPKCFALTGTGSWDLRPLNWSNLAASRWCSWETASLSGLVHHIAVQVVKPPAGRPEDPAPALAIKCSR